MGRQLAILLTHPIQYQSPLMQKLASRLGDGLEVLYCAPHGMDAGVDAGFGIGYTWDRPLLEGYVYRSLKNFSPRRSVNHFWGLINLGVVPYLVFQRPQALLIHGYTSFSTILAYLTCIVLNIPVFFRGETIIREDTHIKALIKKLFFHLFFSRIDAVFPIGKKSREFCLHYGVTEQKLFFTPYAVDNEFFIEQANSRSRVSEKEKLRLPSIPCIIFVGKLIDRKRPLDLLEAFARIPQGKASLVFVGDGALRPVLEKRISELGIKNATITGFQNQSTIPSYYAAADIFAFPSGYESFGLVVNEAMCYSLPIVTTTGVAASADLVDENGYVYPVGDIVALTSHLRELIDNATLRIAMGLKSRHRIEQWSNGVCVQSIVHALDLVKRKRVTSGQPV